jgi:hypothetical protein
VTLNKIGVSKKDILIRDKELAECAAVSQGKTYERAQTEK